MAVLHQLADVSAHVDPDALGLGDDTTQLLKTGEQLDRRLVGLHAIEDFAKELVLTQQS